MSAKKAKSPELHAVILAGGRGTRFWPRSRARTPKQLLNIAGKQTMIQQTVERLSPLFPASHVWVVTNNAQSAEVRRQLPRVNVRNILAEPVGRNTAAAIGLAAFHLLHAASPDAVMAVLPSDHVVTEGDRYRRIVRAAIELAAGHEPGPLVCLGIPPTRPDTGFGYIETAVLSTHFCRQFPARPPLHGEAAAGARPKVCRFRTPLLERGHFLLACINFFGAARTSPPEDPYQAAPTGRRDRHAALWRCATPHLSSTGKHFRRLRNFGAGVTRSSTQPRLRSSGVDRLERHRLVGSRPRIARGDARRKRLGGKHPCAGRDGQFPLEPR